MLLSSQSALHIQTPKLPVIFLALHNDTCYRCHGAFGFVFTFRFTEIG